MAQKEAESGGVRIADYLAATWDQSPLVYGINHPTQRVVFELFRRLCDVVGWNYDPKWPKTQWSGDGAPCRHRPAPLRPWMRRCWG